MPEITFTCDTAEYTSGDITVEQYRRYTELMEKNSDNNASTALLFNQEIIKMIFNISRKDVESSDIKEQLVTAKTIHFVMQDIISKKFLELNPERPDIKKKKSLFDEYDKENGYSDIDNEENIWKICRDNLDRVIKLCVKGFNDSITSCMNTGIISLLDHIAFEIRTINEK